MALIITVRGVLLTSCGTLHPHILTLEILCIYGLKLIFSFSLPKVEVINVGLITCYVQEVFIRWGNKNPFFYLEIKIAVKNCRICQNLIWCIPLCSGGDNLVSL